jgi:hypothetical protein
VPSAEALAIMSPLGFQRTQKAEDRIYNNFKSIINMGFAKENFKQFKQTKKPQ